MWGQRGVSYFLEVFLFGGRGRNGLFKRYLHIRRKSTSFFFCEGPLFQIIPDLISFYYYRARDRTRFDCFPWVPLFCLFFFPPSRCSGRQRRWTACYRLPVVHGHDTLLPMLGRLLLNQRGRRGLVVRLTLHLH